MGNGAWCGIMRVAIVIPTPDASRDMTRRCVEAASRTTAGFDIDLQVVESSGPEFRFSRSINRGLRASKDADAWVLLNDDAWMDEGWLRVMVDAANAHPRVGLVGAVLRFPSGGIQHAGGYIPLTAAEYLVTAARHRAPLWALRRIIANRARDDTYMYAHWHSVSARHRIDFLSAACVLITRPCMEKIGEYDEDFLFGFEDTDHSLRALEAGFELALATRATGIHHESVTAKPLSAKMRESETTFKKKWSVDRIGRATRARGRLGIHA